MKADTLSLKALFQKDVRYVIPTFQRPYVWDQETQWEPLWDDVRNTAERYLEELAGIGGDPVSSDVRAKAQERVGRHFLGAVVVQQRLNAAAELETRDVIDGQQRLTTLQLLADAARRVVDERGFRAEARLLRQIVRNTYADGNDEFKLWPTQLDREPFLAAMRGDDEDTHFEDSQIVQAHAFFRLQVEHWLSTAGDSAEAAGRAHGLATALFALLQLVVIDLSTVDDAAVIFETLNARGTPLLASDLVKNYVGQAAVQAGLDRESFYRAQWSTLEDRWWREEVRQGRIRRPRLDAFLGYWLTMRTTSEVQSHDVFPRFRRYVEDSALPVADVVADLVRVAAGYRRLESDDVAPDVRPILRRLKATEIGVLTPVLLLLFSLDRDALSPAARLRSLAALESFVVRRMVCRLTTQDYNRLFLDLLGRLRRGGGPVDQLLIGYLAGQEAEARQWPDDRNLETAFSTLPLYRLLTRGRLRMVLATIEESLRGPYAEAGHIDHDGLSIEHIMPRSWEKHWPHPGTEQGRIERDRLVHTAGNLTLITGKLNAAQSNASWTVKRAALNAHSVLYLNKRLVDDYGQRDWNEGTIRARSRMLAAQAAKIWPSASALTG